MRDPRDRYPIKRELPLIISKRRSSRRRVAVKTTFAITGNLFLRREVVEKVLTDANYRVVEYVNKHTDYVIVGDNPGKKWNQVYKLRRTNKWICKERS